MRFLRENSLSLFFGALLLASVAGQSLAGQHQYNADRRGRLRSNFHTDSIRSKHVWN